jgi:adenylate cyclase
VADAGRLSAEQLADETDTTVERVTAMVEAGILVPLDDGAFRHGDIQRVLVAGAMEEAGLSLEMLRQGIELGIVSFEQTDEIYPDPGPRSPRTVAGLADEIGVSTDLLLRVITALGLPRPDPDTHLHLPDEAQLRGFFAAWMPVAGEEVMVRAARIYGDALRRAAEGWMSLFEEVMLAPIADRAIPWTEMRERTVVPGMRVLEVGRSMLSWLLDQHRVQDLNRLNYESVERMLALSGIPPAAPRRPAAIVFADLAGYTRLTEELGDEVAAASATRLAAIADEVAQRHHGRLVKLLGDGVMLHFSDPPDAVAAAIAIRDAMGPAGLPAAHIGIDAGAVIRREADYFGRTVNVAARLASVAGAGEILVSASLVTAAGDLPSLRGAEQLAPLELKGIPEPVAALRLA